jgi:hypothetical protein
MRAVPRIVFTAPIGSSDAEALVVAVTPRGELCLQLCFGESRLRGYSEERPPTVTLDGDAAVALAREILLQLAPELAAKLEAKGRPGLRVVNNEGGDAA